MGIYGFAVKNWVSNGGEMVGNGPGLHIKKEGWEISIIRHCVNKWTVDGTNRFREC
jgi:hypothetical protein